MNKDYEFLKEKKEDKENKIIFLDIDGVIKKPFEQKRFDHDMKATCKMLSDIYMDDNYIKMHDYDVCAAYYDFDEIAIGILSKILRITNAKIVISSDWKSIGYDGLKSIFKLYNLEDYIYDVCEEGLKEDSIKNYLNTHADIDKYIIIDDKNMYSDFKDHFRITNTLLTLDDYYYITTYLKYNLKVNDNGTSLSLGNIVTLNYEIKPYGDRNIMYLNGYTNYRLSFKPYLEYLLTYILNYDNVDMFVFDSKGFDIDDLTINGYCGGNNLYYIYKDIYKSYEFKETKKLILEN